VVDCVHCSPQSLDVVPVFVPEQAQKNRCFAKVTPPLGNHAQQPLYVVSSRTQHCVQPVAHFPLEVTTIQAVILLQVTNDGSRWQKAPFRSRHQKQSTVKLLIFRNTCNCGLYQIHTHGQERALAEGLSRASQLLSLARPLKRVLEIDMERCPNCDCQLKIIAAILEQPVI